MSKACVRSIVKSMILVTAGLHAKGFVHLDLKPENLLVFGGKRGLGDSRLKLIDVDGCVKTGSVVSIDDSTLSFSPCYCAPEWARFLIDGSEDSHITISPALDVWSIGMTFCELVTLKTALSRTFASFRRPGVSRQEALFLYMNWLGGLRKCPLSRDVQQFENELVDLLSNGLLVGDASHRKPLAESLDHPYLVEDNEDTPLGQVNSSPVTNDVHQTPKASQNMNCVGFFLASDSDGSPLRITNNRSAMLYSY